MEKRGGLAGALAVIMLAVVVAMIVAGVLALVADRSEESAPTTTTLQRETTAESLSRSSVPSPTPTRAPFSEVSLVDVRTGRWSLLPRGIRSFSPHGFMQVSPDGSRIAFIATIQDLRGANRRHPGSRTCRW